MKLKKKKKIHFHNLILNGQKKFRYNFCNSNKSFYFIFTIHPSYLKLYLFFTEKKNNFSMKADI